MVGVLLCGAATPARAASLEYVIEIGIVESVSPDLAAGYYGRAGRFSFNEELVPETGNAIISWSQMSDFSIDLSPLALSLDHLRAGRCITSDQLPVCGLLFRDGEYAGIVGQYSIADSFRFALRLDNTSPSLFDTGQVFQSASIEDLDLGEVVAGGFVTVSARPMPEPGSVVFFSIGVALVALSLRRSKPQSE